MITYKLRVTLYYGDELPPEERYTQCIDEARQWVSNAKNGTIKTLDNILIQ